MHGQRHSVKRANVDTRPFVIYHRLIRHTRRVHAYEILVLPTRFARKA